MTDNGINENLHFHAIHMNLYQAYGEEDILNYICNSFQSVYYIFSHRTLLLLVFNKNNLQILPIAVDKTLTRLGNE